MKYFYTDPLAAAWMAKHFGMNFTDGIDDEEIFPSSDICRELKFAKYYIHHDSMCLLEPQDNDIMSWNDFKIISERNGIAFMWPKIEK